MSTTVRHIAPLLMLATMLTAALPTAAVRAQSPPRGADALTVATYNVKNFFDVFDDPYTEDETTRVKPRGEIEQLAATLRAVDADVVALQEVENAEALRGMARELLPDQGYRYIHTSAGNDGRGISVGVLSRLPIRSATTHRFRELSLPNTERTWHFARDLLEVCIEVTPEQRMRLFVAHFKSKRDSSDDPESRNWRLAEATAARRIVAQRAAQHPDEWIALVGDFNDTPGSPTLQALLEPADDGRASLIDAHAHLSSSARITYLSKPYRSTIDYMLIGDALEQRLDKRRTRVIQAPRLTVGSDHAPLVARFRLRDR